MTYKIAFLLALSWFGITINEAFAQETLTLQDAVKIALANNYDIKLTANDLEIAKNNVSLANAGMIPSVDGTLTNNHTIQNSSQTQSSGELREKHNAKGSALNYGANLSWTIFNGF